MDPLVPALVAVLLAGVGDRPPLLSAILADRHGSAATIAGIVAQAIGFALAAAAGTLVAPHLSPMRAACCWRSRCFRPADRRCSPRGSGTGWTIGGCPAG
ncbi:hypothetical protein ACVOMT_06975 [Sphingomonas panni]